MLKRHTMEIELEGKRRKTIIEPMVKAIDINGKVYLSKKLAGKRVLVIPLETISGDIERYTRIGGNCHESV